MKSQFQMVQHAFLDHHCLWVGKWSVCSSVSVGCFCDVWLFIFIGQSSISIMFASAFWFHIWRFCNFRYFVVIALVRLALGSLSDFRYVWFPSLVGWFSVIGDFLNIVIVGNIIKLKSASSKSFSASWGVSFAGGNYMFKVNNKNTRTRCEILSKLTITIPERRHGVVLASLLLTLNIFHTLL